MHFKISADRKYEFYFITRTVAKPPGVVATQTAGIHAHAKKNKQNAST